MLNPARSRRAGRNSLGIYTASMVARLKWLGHPVLSDMLTSIALARTLADVESIVSEVAGPTNLMEFLRFDMGEVISKGKPGSKVNSIRFLIGNPITMRRMAEHVPDAASYAPITVLVDERPDGIHLSYDRMSGSLDPYESNEVLAIALELDRTVESILNNAARTKEEAGEHAEEIQDRSRE